MGVEMAPAARAGMLKHAAVDRLVKLGADVSTIALGEALLYPETLKCLVSTPRS
jgi:hypothetical protein